MPPRRTHASRVSPIYAKVGPSRMMVRRYVVGTLDLSADAADEQERQIHDEYREWRRASLEDWLDGVPGTPEPPFVGVLDTGFARLA